MDSLNGSKVTSVRLHVPIHVPGIGSITSPLTKDSGKILGALELTMADGGVLIIGKSVRHWIPGGNIVSVHLEPA